MNKYVSFVSDDDFLKCVKTVTDSYMINNTKDNIEKELKHGKNTTDFIKVLFDVYGKQISLEDWLIKEDFRKNDKNLNSKIGEFHQNLLGSVPGWTNLETGSKYSVDLKNDDDTIFIELKNKHNTMNSTSSLGTMRKLENIIEKHPNVTCYIAYIIEKNYGSKNIVWKVNETDENSDGTKKIIKHEHDNIKLISGYKVYELVTGNSNALEEVFNALPIAINDIMQKENKKRFCLSKKDKQILDEYEEYIFNNN